MKNVKRKIIAQKTKRGFVEEEQFDREFWKNAGHEARFRAAWEMVDEYMLIRGEKSVSQRRLQRSVQNIKRRKG